MWYCLGQRMMAALERWFSNIGTTIVQVQDPNTINTLHCTLCNASPASKICIINILLTGQPSVSAAVEHASVVTMEAGFTALCNSLISISVLPLNPPVYESKEFDKTRFSASICTCVTGYPTWPDMCSWNRIASIPIAHFAHAHNDDQWCCTKECNDHRVHHALEHTL